MFGLYLLPDQLGLWHFEDWVNMDLDFDIGHDFDIDFNLVHDYDLQPDVDLNWRSSLSRELSIVSVQVGWGKGWAAENKDQVKFELTKIRLKDTLISKIIISRVAATLQFCRQKHPKTWTFSSLSLNPTFIRHLFFSVFLLFETCIKKGL